MQKGLFTKYFRICASIILVSVTVLGFLLLTFSSQYFKQDKLKLLARNAEQVATLTAATLNQTSDGYYVNPNKVLPGFSILSTAIDADIFLVDKSGKTLMCTHREACVHTTYLLNDNIISQALTGKYTEVGTLGSMYKEPFYTASMPVVSSTGTAVGAVFVSTSAKNLSVFLSEIFKMFLFSSIAVTALAFIIIYFSTDRLVKPLRDMVNATQSFSKGDFTIRVPVEGYDEVGKLAMAFNNMAGSLATIEQTRRSFIANVSHELKTPMTTIGGFIDGILDGTIPPEKRDHYLQIVSEEVKRLSRLVRSMLNIAKIEAGEMSIVLAPVDINDLVCRTVFTFEHQIDDKNLEIRGLDVGKIMVEADSDLIHQVVYNLVENAVKFVDTNGYIEFNYVVEGNKTYVGIKNSGAGISKDEIAKVFDRFYKSDKSRSLDKNGVGLGLHIVRSIVDLHGGDVMVRSVEGEYCEFLFGLPTHITKNSQSIFRKNDKIK